MGEHNDPTATSSPDGQLLRTIAEHGCLTTPQLAILADRNLAALRRRLRQLAQAGHIEFTRLPALPGARGRPPEVIRLTPTGQRDACRGRSDHESSPSTTAHIPAQLAIPHLLLVNWFRAHLVDLPRRVPEISSAIIVPSNDPESTTRPGMPDLVPDGVFMLRHAELNRALLFFLEADRDTESLTSARGARPTIDRKLSAYQALFQDAAYNHYASHWGATFNGFRLLIFTETRARLAALCRHVAGMPPPANQIPRSVCELQRSGRCGPADPFS